jgi:hypothetical protein
MESRILSINPQRMKYQVHPITIFEVLDHHRRRKDQKRVFGLLVGRKRRRLVEVTGALNILVRIEEETENVDIKYLNKMIELHRMACPRDEIVGLYTTWHAPDYWFAKVHEKIGDKITFGSNALYLVVGTGDSENKIRITGYTSKTMFGICRYVAAPVKLKGSEGENLGVWSLMNCPEADIEKNKDPNLDKLSRSYKLWKSKEVVAAEMQDIEEALSQFRDYVKDQSQRREDVGWDLAAALSEVPCIPEKEFESMISGSIQDLLMIDFLAKLIKVYVNLAAKIQTNISNKVFQ